MVSGGISAPRVDPGGEKQSPTVTTVWSGKPAGGPLESEEADKRDGNDGKAVPGKPSVQNLSPTPPSRTGHPAGATGVVSQWEGALIHLITKDNASLFLEILPGPALLMDLHGDWLSDRRPSQQASSRPLPPSPSPSTSLLLVEEENKGHCGLQTSGRTVHCIQGTLGWRRGSAWLSGD